MKEQRHERGVCVEWRRAGVEKKRGMDFQFGGGEGGGTLATEADRDELNRT